MILKQLRTCSRRYSDLSARTAPQLKVGRLFNKLTCKAANAAEGPPTAAYTDYEDNGNVI